MYDLIQLMHDATSHVAWFTKLNFPFLPLLGYTLKREEVVGENIGSGEKKRQVSGLRHMPLKLEFFNFCVNATRLAVDCLRY